MHPHWDCHGPTDRRRMRWSTIPFGGAWMMDGTNERTNERTNGLGVVALVAQHLTDFHLAASHKHCDIVVVFRSFVRSCSHQVVSSERK